MYNMMLDYSANYGAVISQFDESGSRMKGN